MEGASGLEEGSAVGRDRYVYAEGSLVSRSEQQIPVFGVYGHYVIAVLGGAVHLIGMVAVPVLEESEAPRVERAGGAAAAGGVEGPAPK